MRVGIYMTNTTMKTKNEIIKEFREKFPDRCADTKEAESFFADSIQQAVAEERVRVRGKIEKELEKINDYPLHNEFVKGETEAYKNVLSFLDKPLPEKDI